MVCAKSAHTTYLVEPVQKNHKFHLGTYVFQCKQMSKMHFLHITKTTSALHLTFATPWFLKFNANNSILNSYIEISDLFVAKSLAITPKKIELEPKNYNFLFNLSSNFSFKNSSISFAVTSYTGCI